MWSLYSIAFDQLNPVYVLLTTLLNIIILSINKCIIEWILIIKISTKFTSLGLLHSFYNPTTVGLLEIVKVRFLLRLLQYDLIISYTIKE